MKFVDSGTVALCAAALGLCAIPSALSGQTEKGLSNAEQTTSRASCEKI